MAAPKRPTHIVEHKRFYFTAALAGQKKEEFQHVPEGTPLALSKEQAKGFGRRVKAIGNDVAVMPDAEAPKAPSAAPNAPEGS